MKGLAILTALLCLASGCSQRRKTEPALATPPPLVVSKDHDSSVPPAETEWSNSLGMSFRVVLPGEFLMKMPEQGSERPRSITEQLMRERRGLPPFPPPLQKLVRITKAYAISICEVTCAQFKTVMGWSFSGKKDGSDPMDNVTFEFAAKFCQRLSELPAEKAAGRSYRLPTEAEWQHAGFSRNMARDEACYPWHRTTRHARVWNYCLDVFDEDYYQRMSNDVPTADPLAAGSDGRHIVELSYSHPDPFHNVTTFRIVALSGF